MFSFKVLLVGTLCAVACTLAHPANQAGHSSPLEAMRRVYNNCEASSDLVKCLKVQAVKITERALKLPNLKLVDGLSLVRAPGSAQERSFSEPMRTEAELSHMSSASLSRQLFNGIDRFVSTHEVNVDVPRLLNFGQTEGARMIEEGRKKMKKFYGPFMGALAIKTGILTMAYHSIAVIAAKALIIGKIALIISTIIGLKKLVTPEGHEKTTYEIVKHPHISQSHSFSSSQGEFDTQEPAGYHRSLGSNDNVMQARAFRAHVPRV